MIVSSGSHQFCLECFTKNVFHKQVWLLSLKLWIEQNQQLSEHNMEDISSGHVTSNEHIS